MIKLRLPFFEIGIKNYLYGDDVLKLALAAEKAGKEADIDVLFTTPYTEIRRLAEMTPSLIIIAPYMDTIRPGRGMADVLPEAVKSAGAQGVVINHCERPMTLTDIRKTIDRANELDLLTFVCADTITEAKILAEFHPSIINPEPTELIGSGSTSDMTYVQKSTDAIKAVDPDIIVEQAAGITSADEVYNLIFAGAEAVGAASGICTSNDPYTTAAKMIKAVRKAADTRKELRGVR